MGDSDVGTRGQAAQQGHRLGVDGEGPSRAEREPTVDGHSSSFHWGVDTREAEEVGEKCVSPLAAFGGLGVK